VRKEIAENILACGVLIGFALLGAGIGGIIGSVITYEIWGFVATIGLLLIFDVAMLVAITEEKDSSEKTISPEIESIE